MKPEARVSRAVILLLRDTLGGHVWSTEQGYRKERGGTRTTPGIPDLIVMFPQHGFWTFAELKAGKGKLSPAQKVFQEVSLRAGVPWQLWRSAEDALIWYQTERKR